MLPGAEEGWNGSCLAFFLAFLNYFIATLFDVAEIHFGWLKISTFLRQYLKIQYAWMAG